MTRPSRAKVQKGRAGGPGAPRGGTAAARSPGRRAEGFHQAADFPEEGPGSPGPASLPPTPQRERLPESVPRLPAVPRARGPAAPRTPRTPLGGGREEAGGTGRAARDPEPGPVLGAGAAAGRTPSADPCGASWARGRKTCFHTGTLPEKCTLMHDTGRPRGEHARRRVCDRRLVRGRGARQPSLTRRPLGEDPKR